MDIKIDLSLIVEKIASDETPVFKGIFKSIIAAAAVRVWGLLEFRVALRGTTEKVWATVYMGRRSNW